MSMKEVIFSMMIEALELNEAAEVSQDRYFRAHNKKARDTGQPGSWMFTHKPSGDVDVNNEKEVHTVHGQKLVKAKKSAQQWAAKNGHKTVYIMESVEQIDELSDKTHIAYINRSAANLDSIQRNIRHDIINTGTQSPEYKDLSRMRRNRKAGIANAVKSLTKEEVELDELAIIKNNRKFSNVKRFDTDKETNAFLEKNPDHGVLHTDDGGTYVAKNKNKGALVKALNSLKKEEVELDESWSKGASSSYRSDAIAAAKQKAKAASLSTAANKLGKDNPQHRELMGDHHKAMAKYVKHSYHSGAYPSMAIAKKDYNSHMDRAKEYNSTVTESYELDEAKTDMYHKHMLKALGKTRLPKDHGYTSAIANNGDFVVHDGGGRVAGRIAKGDHDLK